MLGAAKAESAELSHYHYSVSLFSTSTRNCAKGCTIAAKPSV
jgi:hypothetical protein